MIKRRLPGREHARVIVTDDPGVFVRQWTAEDVIDLAALRAEVAALQAERDQIISEPEPADAEKIEHAEKYGRHPYYEMQEQLVEINARIVALKDIITQCEAL